MPRNKYTYTLFRLNKTDVNEWKEMCLCEKMAIFYV